MKKFLIVFSLVFALPSLSTCLDELKTISVLWYPKNKWSDVPFPATHIKLMLDGKVWGTGNTFKDLRDFKTHLHKANRNHQNSFFEYKIKVSEDELNKLKKVLEANDRTKVMFPGKCVHGACGALSASGIQKVPYPFNQIPGLAALFFAVKSAHPKSNIESIEFHGQNKSKSMLSYRVLVDGALVGTLAFVKGALVYSLVFGSGQENED